VTFMGASSLNAPAASGLVQIVQNQPNFTYTPILEAEGMVLQAGDRLALQSSAAVGIGRLQIEGYVF
jgi:hypothetical protein